MTCDFSLKGDTLAPVVEAAVLQEEGVQSQGGMCDTAAALVTPAVGEAINIMDRVLLQRH